MSNMVKAALNDVGELQERVAELTRQRGALLEVLESLDGSVEMSMGAALKFIAVRDAARGDSTEGG